MTHACPCGCGAQVEREKFACRDGWFRLPKPMRNAIYRYYRSGQRAAHLAAMQTAERWYADNPGGAR